MTPELQALTQRLEEVEKQIAHLGALAVEHSDKGQSVEARTVRARGFVVTDAQGVPRAELVVGTADGRMEEQPCLQFCDAEGNKVAHLGVDEAGVPRLSLYTANGKSVLDVLADEQGPQIRMFHGCENGPGVSLHMSERGPQLGLTDANGRRTVLLGVPEGGPSIALLDADGKIRAIVTLEEGWPSLMMCDPDGSLNLKLSVDGGRPRLVVFKDRKVLWSAP